MLKYHITKKLIALVYYIITLNVTVNQEKIMNNLFVYSPLVLYE